MKKLLLVLLTIQLVSCMPEEKSYCGKVVETFRTDAGYKSSPEAHVVFFSDSLQRNIDLKVTWNCYANIKVNQYVCFELADRELNR